MFQKLLTAAGLVSIAGAASAAATQPDAATLRPARVTKAEAARAPVIVQDAQDRPRFRTATAPNGLEGWPAAAVAQLDALDVAPLLAEDALVNKPGVPMRVGVARPMPDGAATPLTAGQWLQTENGELVWRMRVSAENAEGLRLHIEGFDLPEGAELVIGEPDGQSVQRYTLTGPNLNNEFWTGVTHGSEVVVEYQAPAGEPLPTFRISEIAHLYRDVMPERNQVEIDPLNDVVAIPSQTTTTCLIRINCAPDPIDQIARDSVGRVLYQEGFSTFVCSGCLLNDVDTNTFAGWFLTANHCIDDQVVTNSMQVLWFFEHTNCSSGAATNGGASSGGTLIATSAQTDFTLIRLQNDPSLGQGFSAWTTDLPSAGANVKMIHHPGGDPKHYTAGNLTTSSPICNPSFPTSRYWYWDEFTGETRGGSSGAPLFNSNWEVIAQLFGVCTFTGVTPNCKNQSQWNSLGGRFDQTFPAIMSELTSIIPDDIYEDNDASGEAAALTVGMHNLRLVDFEDWFTFDVCEDTTISATTAFDNSEMRQIVRLYDSSLTELDVDSSSGGTKLVEATVGPGTYYVQVEKTLFWGGDYTLVINGGADSDGNGIPDACEVDPCPADLDGNGQVGSEDLALVLGSWGGPGGDLNGDGGTDSKDLALLLGSWGPCPS